MGQRQTTEVIGSVFRDSLLLLLLMQQLMIVWEAALEPGCLLNKEKQQCFKTLCASFWNKNAHIVAPNEQHTLDNLSKPFLDLLKNKIMPNKFLFMLLWYFPVWQIIFRPFEMYFVVISSENKIV